jgi:ABC-type transport system involved in multi-copper enzyme maturation permease subunit
MTKLLAIASVSLREALSRKIQVNLLLFGLALVAASFLASALTIGEQHRIIADFGLSAMGFVTVLLAAFLGAALVAGDVERRVLYAVVAKPVSRPTYLLGRYLGLSAALVLNVLAMAALLAALLAFEAGSTTPLDGALLAAVAMLCAKALVVAAVGVLFSSFTTTTLAAIFTLAVAIAGHLTDDMRALWKGGADWIPQLVWYAIPNLSGLTLNELVVYRTPVGWAALLPALHGMLYAATALALAAAVFERRDFR